MGPPYYPPSILHSPSPNFSMSRKFTLKASPQMIVVLSFSGASEASAPGVGLSLSKVDFQV